MVPVDVVQFHCLVFGGAQAVEHHGVLGGGSCQELVVSGSCVDVVVVAAECALRTSEQGSELGGLLGQHFY